MVFRIHHLELQINCCIKDNWSYPALSMCVYPPVASPSDNGLSLLPPQVISGSYICKAARGCRAAAHVSRQTPNPLSFQNRASCPVNLPLSPITERVMSKTGEQSLFEVPCVWAQLHNDYIVPKLLLLYNDNDTRCAR